MFTDTPTDALTSEVRKPELAPTNVYWIAGTTIRVRVPEPESWGNARRLMMVDADSVPEPDSEAAWVNPVAVRYGMNAPEPDRLADTDLLFTVPPVNVPVLESAAELDRDTLVMTPDNVPLPDNDALEVKLFELAAVRSPTPDRLPEAANPTDRVELNVPELDRDTDLLTAGTTVAVSEPDPEPRNAA